MKRDRSLVSTILLTCALTVPAAAEQEPRGERITQEQVADLPTRQLQLEGLRVFTTLLTHEHGYGDGPNGRPTLQGNGTLLRVNGLDGRGCIECHATVSARTVPPTFGIGGVGGSVTNAMIMPTTIDPVDLDADGAATFDGRFVNPPFVFGAGGVELLAMEMTEDLQVHAAAARANPGQPVHLLTKGVSFGTIRAAADGTLDVSGVEGIDDDLVVRPFGRKGEFATTREFDIGAMQFHFGMEPVEVVGEDVDADGDGIANEVLAGELSALGVFLATLDRPVTVDGGPAARRGEAHFGSIGCADCHRPQLETRGYLLPMRLPEVATRPRENVYRWLDLRRPSPGFERAGTGVRVPLYADLKRHDMGPGLAESFVAATDRQNRQFTTARLWGVADTAPYLHDGRATTLREAVLLHGGEAASARDAFAALGARGQDEILAFLDTLRTPTDPAQDLVDALRRAP